MLSKKTLQEINEVKPNNNRLLSVYEVGSKLHHMHTKNSDKDYLAIIMPNQKDIVENKKTSKQYIQNNYDLKVMDLLQFYQQLRKSNPAIIELLYTDPVFINNYYHTDLFAYLKQYQDDILLNLNPLRFIAANIGLQNKSLKQYQNAIKTNNYKKAAKAYINSELTVQECIDFSNWFTIRNSYYFKKSQKRQKLLDLKNHADTILNNNQIANSYESKIKSNLQKCIDIKNNDNLNKTFKAHYYTNSDNLKDILINKIYQLLKQN